MDGHPPAFCLTISTMLSGGHISESVASRSLFVREGRPQSCDGKETRLESRYGSWYWQIVIPPKYDGAFPFEHGHATVCIGCSETCVIADHPHAGAELDCDHHVMTGGEWFKIDKAGDGVPLIWEIPVTPKSPRRFW